MASLFALLLPSALGQTRDLDSFGSPGAGGVVLPFSTWVGQVERQPAQIVVGGSARDDNGWGASGLDLDLQSFRYLTIVARRDVANQAPAVVFQLEDAALKTHTISVPSSQFPNGNMTEVTVPIGTWSPGFNAARVTGWSIGGGSLGLVAFRFSLDHLALAVSATTTPPFFLADLPDQWVTAGAPLRLTVTATGGWGMRYRWTANGTTLATTTEPTYTVPAMTPGQAGTYQVEVLSENGSAFSRSAAVTVAEVLTEQTLSNGRTTYEAGSSLTLLNTFGFVGATAAPTWRVTLPAGWIVTSDEGGSSGATRSLNGADVEWAWTTIPSSPVTFSYTVLVPAQARGIQTISAAAGLTLGGTRGTAVAAPLQVLPLPQRHSADTRSITGNNLPDGRIDVFELLRVIEVYNTRNGSTRTGAYRVDASGEDGFAPDFTGGGGALAKYHSADSDRNGRLSLVELTRLIELYNYRAAGVRTGQYRFSAGTEDDFQPGS
jgi:hypothetical protein